MSDLPHRVHITNSGSGVAGGSAVARHGGEAVVGDGHRDITVIIQYLTDGPRALPINYGVWIENFLYEYLDRPEQWVPFRGRREELAALDGWLADAEAPPYALLTAEAGRGKSALLVQWMLSLVERV